MIEPLIHVEFSKDPPNPLKVIEFLKNACRDCGALTIYVGIVKPFSSCGSRVKGLEVSIESRALEELRSRALEIARECSCKAMYIWHREGFAEGGSELAMVGAIAMTRHQVLEAVRKGIELIKGCSSIRRREVLLEP